MLTAYWFLAGVIILLILLSAFFSGSETAFTATSKARLHTLEKGGDKRAGTVSRLIDKRDRLIGTLLIGNNLVNILASALATTVFLELFGQAGVFIATAIMTVLLVIFAEIMPKYWALSEPDRIAIRVAPFLAPLVKILAPVVRLVTGIARATLKLMGVKIDDQQSLVSGHEEIRGAVEVLHKEGSVEKDEKDRLGGLLDLAQLDVADVMIHRTKMFSINIDDPSDQILKQVLESPYTRIPIWKNESENIVGIIHSKNVLRKLASGKATPDTIDFKRLATKPWFVPDTTNLQDQLNAFLRRKAHFALVVDEYGEVEGLVTLEDILEEIVGEISDEHDEEVQGVVHEPDGSYTIEGSVPIRDINRALDWHLPDEEATTIAGLVIHEAQMIPEAKQTFTFYGKRFVVVAKEKNRITQLRVRKI